MTYLISLRNSCPVHDTPQKIEAAAIEYQDGCLLVLDDEGELLAAFGPGIWASVVSEVETDFSHMPHQ